MLKGVLDCPELPLNVSRSYLQKNTYVSKVSAHIVKKIADKINSLRLNENEKYLELWNDISPFIEYACMRDKKLYDRVKDSLLLTLTDSSKVTYSEYLDTAKEKHEKTVYYATDRALQAQYISMFASEGIKVALFEKPIDVQFATMLEQYMEGVKFVRIDSEVADVLKADGEITENEAVRDLFVKVSGSDKLSVKFDSLKSTQTPAILNISEQSRRMEEMMKLYGMNDKENGVPLETTLVVNTASPLIAKLTQTAASDTEKAEKIASYIYKVSLLSQKKFSADEMQSFINDSFDILMNY